MKLYSDEMLNTFYNKKRKGIKFILFPLLVIIPIFVFLLIKVNLKTKVLFTFLCGLDLSIFSVILVYNLLENIIKSNDMMIHINGVLSDNFKEIDGVITNISKPLTLKRNIHIIEIEIKGKEINKTYLNIDLFKNEFEVGMNVNIKISNNFIVEYEVKK